MSRLRGVRVLSVGTVPHETAPSPETIPRKINATESLKLITDSLSDMTRSVSPRQERKIDG